ncbi:MAG: hypothetical protein IPK85_15540 [Gemmatimonadetes bacterium]|nr:hypothetical protein [Gemmatimonadota bacterium]
MRTSTPGHTQTAGSLAPRLHEALTDLAAAVQRRAIYPAGHPVLRGAVNGVWERVSACLAETGSLDLGIGGRRFVHLATESDAGHPLLGDLASRLSAHRVGGLRLTAGVSAVQLGEFIDAISCSPDAADAPRFDDDDRHRWSHIEVRAIAFDRLGLIDDLEAPVERSSAAAWRALASTAFSESGADAGEGPVVSPAAIAAALLERSEAQGARVDQFEEFLHSLGGADPSDAGVEQAVAVIESLGRAGLARVFEVLGEVRTQQLIRGAVDQLPVGAAVDLVHGASDARGRVVSSSLMRMLQKVGDVARTGRPNRKGDRLLQLAIRRLLHEWTLESPNPLPYDEALVTLSSPQVRGVDRRRDVVEPERLVDLALEVGDTGAATDTALSRLVMRDGLAATMAFLAAYPATEVRERLMNRLVNESSVREHLAQPVLDVGFLRQAVDRLRHRAALALVDALQRRPEGDVAILVDLLQRIGWDALEPIGARAADATPRVQRALVTLFDALDAWPPQLDPLQWMTHPDFMVRRETIKHLLKGSATRDLATLTALRDADVRMVAIGLHAIAGTCSPAAAREVMHRYADPGFTTELRVRAIRAVASSGGGDVATWLTSLVRRRRRWFGGERLAKPTPEALSAVGALAQWYPRHPAASEVLRLAQASRQLEFRRAASGSPVVAHA